MALQTKPPFSDATVLKDVATRLGLSPLAAKNSAPVSFNHVTPAAQPFVVAAIVRGWPKAGNIWVVCETERDQERMHMELATWIPEALIFPHLEVAAVEGAIPDPETTAERLSVLQTVSTADAGCVIVLNKHSFEEHVFAPSEIEKHSYLVKTGQRLDRDILLNKLSAAGYENVSQVAERGHYAVRGGLVDLYSWQQQRPVRIEWFDDEITSLREFDLDEQISIRSLEKCSVLLEIPETTARYLRDFRKNSDVVVSVGDAWDRSDATISDSGNSDSELTTEDYTNAFYESPLTSPTKDFHAPGLRDSHERLVTKQLQGWLDDGWKVIVQYRKPSELSHLQSFAEKFTGKVVVDG